MENTLLKEKFDYTYENVIKPKLNNLAIEQMQLNKQNTRYKFLYSLSIIITILIAIFFIFPEDFKYDLFYAKINSSESVELYINVAISVILFISLLFMSVFLTKSINLMKGFEKKLKESLLKEILTVFDDCRLEENELITLTEVNSTELFSSTGKIDDDCLNIKYNNIPICVTETKLYHNEGKTTVFDLDGIILRTAIINDYYGITTGKPAQKKYDSPLINALRKEININFLSGNSPRLKKIDGLNSPLCETFDIYSTDYETAEKVITPEFQEIIKCINELFETEAIKFAFVGGYLYLFLDKPEVKGQMKGVNGFFEVGNFKEPVTDEYIYDNLLKELSAFNTVFEKLAAGRI